MQERILALDIGGTSVKSAVFYKDEIKKKKKWEHSYKSCGLEKAKEDLIYRIKKYYNLKIDAIGLSVAGLIATDNSLYRSTVLTSFQGFNIPEFLKQELGVKIITIDNDADCGAISEKKKQPDDFLYVVVGSGIGSAYVDFNGNIPYKMRFDQKRVFSEKDNPILNDIGQRIPIFRWKIYKKFAEYGVKREAIDKIINPLAFPDDVDDSFGIKIGQLGSASGLKRIIDILIDRKGIDRSAAYSNLHNPTKKNIDYIKNAFDIFGYFLGYAIASAEIHLYIMQKLENFPDVVLSGAIMNSFDLFEVAVKKKIKERKIDCEIKLSNDTEYSNVHGAYLRAVIALKEK